MTLALASSAMVLNLIRASNPNLPMEITQDNARLLNPTTIPTPNGGIVNTELSIVPKPRSGYTGKTKVKYRRINLGTLFRSITVEVEAFSPAPPGSYAFKISGLLPYLNKKYGLSLTIDDIVDAWMPPDSMKNPGYVGRRSSSVTVKANPKSLGYIGSFVMRWLPVKQRLNKVVTVTDIPGRLFPGGNDFDQNQRTRLNSETYGIDFTLMLAEVISNPWGGNPLIDYMSGGVLFGDPRSDILVAHGFLLSKINQYCKSSYVIDKNEGWEDLPNNMNLGTIESISLPSAKYPEANSINYKKLIVIKPNVATSWSEGVMFLHHNYGI